MSLSEMCPLCGGNGATITNCMGVKIYSCSQCGIHWCDRDVLLQQSTTEEYVTGLNTLNHLREHNSKLILAKMREHFPDPQKARGLEVGCAVGIFLEEATKEGYQMCGIEPMDTSYEAAKKKGLNVWNGFFPEDMQETEPFDFIVFNDVYEHIPDLHATMRACKKYLKEGGYLIINLPDRKGVLYKSANFLNRMSNSAALVRLWQFQTKSPHLYYFSSESISNLAAQYGFVKQKTIRIPAYQLQGLYQRVRAVNITPLYARAYWIGLVALYPFLHFLPSDTKCYFFQKEFQRK